MKSKFFLLFKLAFILLIFAFSTNCAIPEKKQNKRVYPPTSSLDSLQGKWVNEDNANNQIVINGRYWNEQYNSNVHPLNKFYRIYFSDTIVNVDNFLNANIDTTSLSGSYIITVTESDKSMECWELNGFDYQGTDTTFSINPAKNWTMKSLISFKKIQ